jgi:diguanylate cyclase (GGDEF)-like protein
MRHIGTIFAPRNWSLLLLDPERGELSFTIVTGTGSEALRGKTIPAGTGIAGWIAEKGESLIVEDVSRDSRFNAAMDAESRFTTKSIIGVPLKTKDKVIGVIELINKLEDQCFTPLDLKILQTIADFAAIAIERHYYLHALHKMSHYDSLTGLPNRRSFEQALEREEERSRRTGKPYSLLLLDIDEFKEVNDRHGHAEGDRVLREFAAMLQSRLRSVDVPARIGGDEFTVILPDTDQAKAAEVRERLLEAVAAISAGRSVPFSVSIGLSTAGRESGWSVVEGADRDMYRQKQRRLELCVEDIPGNLQAFIAEEQRSIAP